MEQNLILYRKKLIICEAEESLFKSVLINQFTERKRRELIVLIYKLFVKGNTRSGIYNINPAGEGIDCIKKDVTNDREKDDCISMVIVDSTTGSNLEENWVFLHGKPWQIVWSMDNKLQIAKLMTNPIFDYLDTVGKDEVVTISYPLEEPSQTIRGSAIHRTLRSVAHDVICDLFEVGEVKILSNENK